MNAAILTVPPLLGQGLFGNAVGVETPPSEPAYHEPA